MKNTNSQILTHLENLLLEINFYRPEEDVLDESGYANDPFVVRHLRQVKLRIAKAKAAQTKQGLQAIVAEFQRMINLGTDELNKIFSPEEQKQLMPLFRKFEKISEQDDASIADDTELLSAIKSIRERLEENEQQKDRD